MKELSKSVALGLLTIFVWFLASIEFSGENQMANDLASIENNIEKEDSSIETLTMDYKDTTNKQSYNR